jgi:hypothetical protein
LNFEALFISPFFTLAVYYAAKRLSGSRLYALFASLAAVSGFNMTVGMMAGFFAAWTALIPFYICVALTPSLTGGDSKFDVVKVVEKPEKPPSKLAIMPFYIFSPEIIEVLEVLDPGLGGEIQLTDAIQKLIDGGRRVVGVMLRDDEMRLDVGTPETYWEAVKTSYEYFGRMGR